MNHKGTKQIETERLILRPFRMEDADTMYRNWASDSEVTRYLTWNAHPSVEVTRQILESWTKAYSDPANYQWAIELKKIGEPIGSIAAVEVNENTEAVTIGYCIGKKWWHQGIMTEALNALLSFFFEEVGARCINACHDPRNPNSGKVMQKCGMKPEGIRREAGFNNQGICDEVWHSILRKEYFEKNGLWIETDRLLIREFTPDMAEDVHRNSLDEDNRRFVPDEVFETIEDAQETVDFLIGQYCGTDGPFVYPVLLKNSLKNIGYVQLIPLDEGWEIGYHIAKAYTGKGYAAEAASAFLPVMAKKHDLQEIYGICLADNKASVRVMEKCGFERLYAGPGPYQGEEREIVRNIWRSHESVQIREAELTPELLNTLIRMSEDWESENSCYGYRKNDQSDIEGNRIFIAGAGDEAVGYLFGHIEKAKKSSSIMPDDTPFFEVEELYVKPEYRSQGIGRRLFAEAEKAVSAEAEFILLSTATKNWKAIFHFYLDELGMDFWSARLFKKVNP